MKVIVAGSRECTDVESVKNAIAEFGPSTITELVHGGCRGVDTIAHDLWEGVGPIKVFRADWAKHGRAAGPVRNREMAEYADALIAVWDGKSRGTKNMIDEMKSRGKRTFVYFTNGGPNAQKAP